MKKEVPFETLPSPVTVERKDDDVVQEICREWPTEHSLTGRVNGVGAVSIFGSTSMFRSSEIEALALAGGAKRWGSGVEMLSIGPRRNRAWPVRLRREITCLNLKTVKSVSCCCVLAAAPRSLDDMIWIKCCMP